MRWRWGIGAVLAVLAAVLWYTNGATQTVSPRGLTADARHEEERRSSRSPVSREVRVQEARPDSPGGLRIRGTVLGADGIPLAGAPIVATAAVPHETLSELRCPVESHRERMLLQCPCERARALLEELVTERRGEAPPLARTTSDAAGRFTLEGLEAGRHALWTEGSFGAGHRQDVAAGTEGVTLQVRPGMSHSGRVVDEHGAPVPGALVTVLFVRHSRFFETLADADGSWRTGPLPDGDQMLVFTREGFLSERVKVRDDVHGLRQTLRRPLRMVGRVVLGGQPVAGARVHAARGHDTRDTTTDARGRFTFEGLRPGEYRVSATHAGLDAAVSSTFGPGEDAPELLLRLGSGVRVTGRVRDAAGRPISGATVSAWSLEEGERGGGGTSRTAPDGTYMLGPLETGDYGFGVSAPRYVRRTDVELRLTEPTGQDFVLEDALLVEGRVVGPGGEPLAGVRLSLKQPDSTAAWDDETSGEDGTFLLKPPKPGSYSLLARHDEYLSARQSVLAPSSGLQVVMRAGASVDVELVDEAGVPVPEARLVLLPQSHPDLGRWLTTDERGRATFKGLEAGSYVVDVWAGEGSLARRLWREVVVRGLEPVRMRLQLEEGLALSGLVVDDTGSPVTGARVHLRRWPPQPDPPDPDDDSCVSEDRTPVLLTGPDGRFRMEHLEAGRDYRLRALKEGLESVPDTFRAGTTDVRLVLERREPPSEPPP